MSEVVARPAGESEDDEWLLAAQSVTEAYYGGMRKAREFSRRAADSALRAESKEGAAFQHVHTALRQAELGNDDLAKREVAAALALSPAWEVKVSAALAMARMEDAPKAKVLAEELKRNHPTDTLMKFQLAPNRQCGHPDP